MTNLSSDSQIQKMLSIIYQIPMGLIETDKEGNIQQMNARSVQLLMPQFFSHGLTGTNFHQLLQLLAPDLLEKITHTAVASGIVINQQRQELLFDEGEGTSTRHFIFTVNRLDANSLMYIFDDITELYFKEKQLSQSLQDKAVEQSKFEIASGVLHDIGNAVVGFGAYITKIKRITGQHETGTLEKLKDFFEKNQPALAGSLGQKKASAVLDLLNGLIISQYDYQKEINQAITDQLKIISHVQEILTIQRQYVVGQQTERLPVNIRSVINDSVAMLFGSIDKNQIGFQLDAPAVLPKIKGDRTRLMQVFLNLLKNAVDAFKGVEQPSKEILVTIVPEETTLTVRVEDNGSGFDQATAANLFTRGYTTKTEGTGLGLDNCRKIIEAHNGNLTVTSGGTGQGAVSTVIFYL